MLLLASGCTEVTPHTNHYEKASTSTFASDTTIPDTLPTNAVLPTRDDVLPSRTSTTSSYRSWPSTSSSTIEIPTEPTAPQEPLPPADVLLDVRAIPQYPTYPTGCESVTAVMALQYAGISITVDDFIDKHLVCDNYNFYWMDGVLHGPDPYSVFVGDPRSEYSYGCMAPVIENALRSCVGNKKEIINTTGRSLSDLCATYIDQGIPVILWATMEMLPVQEGTQWHLPNGKLFTWPSGEHCLLLIGYNDTAYFFNDPMHGKTVVYDKTIVEQRYRSLNKQSIVIA